MLFADPLQMPHACHHFCKCHKILTFCSLLARCRIPCACHAKPHLPLQKWSEHVVLFTFWLGNVLRATTACTFSTSQLPKALRSWCALCILTWKCASRHNGVHFFDISTSKSAPSMVRFVHFDLEICFAPQRRALFHISTSKSGPNMVCVCCTSWLPNVLRATAACTFSTSQLVKVLRSLTSCFAPQRHAIFHLSSCQMAPHPPLWRAYFLTLRSHESLEKHSESRLSYLFAHLHLLSSDSFSSLIFSLLELFSSLTLPICFSTCSYCQKFHF